MNSEKTVKEGRQKSLLLGLALVLAASTLLVYSPCLSQAPLFDESYLLSWLSHCLKSGLGAGDTTAFLFSSAADHRDGLTVLGSAQILITALLTGTAYGGMRFFQILLHLGNAGLLFAAVYSAVQLSRSEDQSEDRSKEESKDHAKEKTGEKPGGQSKEAGESSLQSTGTAGNGQSGKGGAGSDERAQVLSEGKLSVQTEARPEEQAAVRQAPQPGSQPVSAPAYALAAVAALFFCIFPLAPEAVASIFSLPIQGATYCMLAATALLLFCRHKNIAGPRQKQLLIAATMLGMVAPWISLKAAFLVTLPVVLLVVAHGYKRLTTDKSLQPVLIATALILASCLPAEVINWSNQKDIPETVKQLQIEKISLTSDSDQKNTFLESGPGANLVAMALPVNRSIDGKYNKMLRSLYLLLPLPMVIFLAAVLTSFRFRLFGLSAAIAVVASAFCAAGAINGQDFYGARWLYPLLPWTSLIWALICMSPIFVETGKRQTSTVETLERLIKIGLCSVFVLAAGLLFFQLTFRQALSYKSDGKLWSEIKESITITGEKQTSPFIIVRNLPEFLSVEPIISPFRPLVLDTQSGLPRTASLSAGRLKDDLRQGKLATVTLHYEKPSKSFQTIELVSTLKPFGPVLDGKKLSEQLVPPILYYNGAIKMDDKQENLLMESHTRAGPAISMQCYGMTPLAGDFLFVDAKVDTPQSFAQNGKARLELHWLTNWQGDWEARDRRVITTGPVSDGQYHRYYFPLRTLAWTTNGLPTNLMIGFPGGSTVAVKGMGICQESVPIPEIHVQALQKQEPGKNYFSHYCFNFPDLDELGLCAAYGPDNGLEIKYDVSKVPDARGALVEIAPLADAFRSENASDPVEESIKIPAQPTSGSLKVPSAKLAGGGLFSVRVFAAGQDGKPIGHASDSLKCLVDQRL